MAWFEINGNRIVSRDYNPWSEDNGAVWGLYIGGGWCLDYQHLTRKLDIKFVIL